MQMQSVSEMKSFLEVTMCGVLIIGRCDRKECKIGTIWNVFLPEES